MTRIEFMVRGATVAELHSQAESELATLLGHSQPARSVLMDCNVRIRKLYQTRSGDDGVIATVWEADVEWEGDL